MILPFCSLCKYVWFNVLSFFVELGAFQAGIKPSASMMLTSVKTLSLKVRFGVLDDVKMLASFLRCFPNVEALHIMVLALLLKFSYLLLLHIRSITSCNVHWF